MKAAEWFENADPVLRAEHLHMAGDPRAARAYLDAARLELAKYRYQQAITLLCKGKPLAVQPADRIDLALALGEAQNDVGALEEARAAFSEALEVAADDAARCRAWLGLAGVKRITEDLGGALADIDSAEAAARRQGLVAEEARAHYLRGNILFPRGDIEGCMREHGLALALAKQAGSVEIEAAALGGLADAEYLRGRFLSACERFTECVETSRVHGLGRIEVANQPMIAITAIWCGELKRALDVALDSIGATRRVGHRRAEMIAHHGAFFCYRMRAEFALARQHIEPAILLARSLGARRFEAEAMLFKAELDFLVGDRKEALEAARTAVAISRESGMSYMGPTILGGLVLITDDKAERSNASAEAEALLAAGSISHNHVLFRIYAIDACLREGIYDEALRHADAITAHCPEPGLRLITFFADRGRALARFGLGERGSGLLAETERLIAEGEQMLQALAITELRHARAALLK
jgi:tetratricopeptide (TPR) repeat protein